MIYLFLIILLLTFIIVRVGAHWLHDRENYGTGEEKSKTPTFLLRKTTKWDIHHIHIGFVILVIVLPLIIIQGISEALIVFLAIGLSLVADQITSDQVTHLVNKKRDYFDKKRIIEALIIHILIAIIALIMMFVYRINFF